MVEDSSSFTIDRQKKRNKKFSKRFFWLFPIQRRFSLSKIYMQLLPKFIRTKFPSLDLHVYSPTSQSEHTEPQSLEGEATAKSSEQARGDANRFRYRVLYRLPLLGIELTSGKRRQSDFLCTDNSSLDKIVAPLEKRLFPIPSGSAFQALCTLAEQTLEQLNGEHADLLCYELEEVKDQIIDIAYALYADVVEEQQQSPLTDDEQEKLLDKIREVSIKNGCSLFIQVPGIGDLKSHHYILPSDYQKRCAAGQPGISRISLCLNWNCLVDATDRLAQLFAKFDFISEVKVVAPSEQHHRKDNLIIYLNQVDLEQAQDVMRILYNEGDPAAWRSHAPPGMHSFYPGIFYGELSKQAVSSSFGDEHCTNVVEAIIENFSSQTPLETALRKKLSDKGYSAENPAFLARS